MGGWIRLFLYACVCAWLISSLFSVFLFLLFLPFLPTSTPPTLPYHKPVCLCNFFPSLSLSIYTSFPSSFTLIRLHPPQFASFITTFHHHLLFGHPIDSTWYDALGPLCMPYPRPSFLPSSSSASHRVPSLPSCALTLPVSLALLSSGVHCIALFILLPYPLVLHAVVPISFFSFPSHL